MNKSSPLIENLKLIYGYGYTNIFSEVHNAIAEQHISESQIKIIAHIYNNDYAFPSELAEVLGVQKSAITHSLKKLQHKKLIVSKENTLTNDKRSKLVYLTDEAIYLLKDFESGIQNKIFEDVSQLNKDEEEALIKATEMILKYLPGGTSYENTSEI